MKSPSTPRTPGDRDKTLMLKFNITKILAKDFDGETLEKKLHDLLYK